MVAATPFCSFRAVWQRRFGGGGAEGGKGVDKGVFGISLVVLHVLGAPTWTRVIAVALQQIRERSERVHLGNFRTKGKVKKQ